MTSDRRLQTADLISQGKNASEIAEEVGYKDRQGVYEAVKSPEVKEQIAFHRDNLFEQSRIDRVKLLKELYQRATQPTGPIFDTLMGDGEFLDARNLSKLEPHLSCLIQQVEVEPMIIKRKGDITCHASVIKKIRFHSPDSALKILSKAAGFEDGILSVDPTEIGGPFRGLIIVPPRQPRSDCGLIDTERSGEGPPENPI